MTLTALTAPAAATVYSGLQRVPGDLALPDGDVVLGAEQSARLAGLGPAGQQVLRDIDQYLAGINDARSAAGVTAPQRRPRCPIAVLSSSVW
jgi:hypothetical protein